MAFELPSLKYSYDALEPHIDSKTMEIHHGKHHAGYTNNLNNAIKDSDLEGKSIEEILSNLNLDNSAVRNNGGGFYNHCLFWDILSPQAVENQPALCPMQFQIHLGVLMILRPCFRESCCNKIWLWVGLVMCSSWRKTLRFVLQRIRITL